MHSGKTHTWIREEGGRKGKKTLKNKKNGHREIEKKYTTGYQNLQTKIKKEKKEKTGKKRKTVSIINYTSITKTQVKETKSPKLSTVSTEHFVYNVEYAPCT